MMREHGPLSCRINIMNQKFLDVLMLGRCSHEFSWPRRAADGHYYQVCLLCAAEYKYDWKRMRRTERLENTADRMEASTTPSPSVPGKKPSWVPRARRLKLNIAMRYRAKAALGAWHAATIENISQSGVLFHGEQSYPANTLVEMVFEMPEEISGQKNSNVLAQGRIIRAKDGHAHKAEAAAFGLAASILDYKFLHKN